MAVESKYCFGRIRDCVAGTLCTSHGIGMQQEILSLDDVSENTALTNTHPGRSVFGGHVCTGTIPT